MTPTSILLAWLGQTDLNAAGGDPKAGLGPIAQAAGFRNFARIVLLSDYMEKYGIAELWHEFCLNLSMVFIKKL